MFKGETWSAAEMAGTAVFRMVVSSDSMKNATATSHGKTRLLAVPGAGGGVTEEALGALGGAIDDVSTLSAQILTGVCRPDTGGTFQSLFLRKF
jgi:hypothetical protein